MKLRVAKEFLRLLRCEGNTLQEPLKEVERKRLMCSVEDVIHQDEWRVSLTTSTLRCHFCKGRNFRKEFNFVAFVRLKRAYGTKLNSIPNFPPCPAVSQRVTSQKGMLCTAKKRYTTPPSLRHKRVRSSWKYEIKFRTNGLVRKSTKFFAYENFFFYSTQ